MSPIRPSVSDTEREVLHVLWDGGPQTVRDVQEGLVARQLNWQRSTVITLLQRLEKKGYVDSDRSSHAYVFSAAVTRDELVHQRLQEVADELCAGAAAPLLLAFAQHQSFSASELAELKCLIDELSTHQSNNKRKR
jgi:predicted transcriptional regulator